VRQIEDQYIAEGAQVIWMLQTPANFQTADGVAAQDYAEDTVNSDVGIRVGDDDTLPNAGAFRDSSFITSNRGFVMIVRKRDMQIVFEETTGNAREISAEELLDEVRNVAP